VKPLPALTFLLYLTDDYLTTGLKDSVGLGKAAAALAFLAYYLFKINISICL
jgi:hypothetical protein